MKIRIAIPTATGRLHGPELPRVAALLGRERCLRRLREAAGGGNETRQGGRAGGHG